MHSNRLAAGVRRAFLLLAIVPAIVLGLLAMHVLSTGTDAAAGHHAGIVTMIDHAAAGHHDAGTDAMTGCGPECGDDIAAAAGCVLALLGIGFGMLLPASWVSRSWLLRPVRLLPSLIRTAIAPMPPSLDQLSISRT
ncbi:DUF6153 family protein [Agromyces bauzanensis]